MIEFQLWLEQLFLKATPVAAFMRTRWGWPIVESVHFIGLTLLFGSIAVWDLRLIGLTKRAPIAAFHRFVPLAVAGFVINMLSGSLFLMTEPDQYLYNSAFHYKLLFIGLAGLNVLLFYATLFRRIRSLGPGTEAPLAAKLFGASSLVFWIGVIVCGRLITWFRPFPCEPGEAIGFLASCLVR